MLNTSEERVPFGFAWLSETRRDDTDAHTHTHKNPNKRNAHQTVSHRPCREL